MTDPTRDWITEDLERFHDDELEEPRRSEVSEALRRGPQLRERYATVRRVDDLMRAAITDENVVRRPRLGVGVRLGTPAVAAACLLIVVSGAWWLTGSRSQRGDAQVMSRDVPDEVDRPVEPEYRPIRVVFSVPVRAASRQTANDQDAGADLEARRDVVTVAMREDPSFLIRLDRALDSGRIEEALDVLNEASRDQRAVAYRYMGELLRSASVAEQILDWLSPQEQVAVCGHWAWEPVVRSVAFARLRRFSTEPELAEDVRVVVDKLAGNPTLESWLRSYQLVGHDVAGKDVSS